MKNHKTYYHRNLPHFQPKDGVFAITMCLSGTLPKDRIQTLKDAKDIKLLEIKHSDLSEKEKQIARQQAEQLYFGKFDALLDGEAQGPTWLKNSAIAQLVADSLHYRDNKIFKLVAYSIMSNHVHLVIYKCNNQLFSIMKDFKSYTGQKANEILFGRATKGEKRKSFWQHESYDHLMRGRIDFNHQVAYTVNNPVKARLVNDWKSWKFSYLKEEFQYIM